MIKVSMSDFIEALGDKFEDTVEQIDAVTESLDNASEAMDRYNNAAKKLESAMKTVDAFNTDLKKLQEMEQIAAKYEKDKAEAEARARAIDEKTRQQRIEWECDRVSNGLPTNTPSTVKTGDVWAYVGVGGLVIAGLGWLVSKLVEAKEVH